MTPSDNTPSLWPKARVVEIAFALIAVLVALAHLALRAKGVFLYSFDLGGIETNVVYVIHKAILGLPMYSDPEQGTFDIVQYPPLYFLVVKCLSWMIGLSPDNVYGLFVLNRSFALVCNIGTMLFLRRMALDAGVPKWWALFWVAVAFGTLPIQLHGRTDSLYLLLFIGAMKLSLRAISLKGAKNVWRYWLAASLLAGLSALTKQTGMLTVGIIGLYHLLRMDVRNVIQHALTALLVIGIGLGSTAWSFGAEILYKNIVIGVRNGYRLDMLKEVFLKHGYAQLVGIHLASAWLVVKWWRSVQESDRFLALAMACAFLFAVITGLKSGSKINYFMEHFMLTYLALAIALSRAGSSKTWRAVIAGYGLQYMILCLAVEGAQLKRADPGGKGRSQYAQDKELVRLLRGELGLAMNDQVYLYDRGYLELLLNGQTVMNQKDVIHFSPPGLYDHSAFHEAMRSGGIRYVISRKQLDKVFCLGRPYGPLTSLGQHSGYFIYRNAPKPPQGPS